MKHARYTTLLLDLDHTLLDSDASEVLAFEHALGTNGVSDPSRYLPAYIQINRALWLAVERDEVTPDFVRTARFERLVATTGLHVDPLALAGAFVIGLGQNGELYPGVIAVLDALGGRIQMALVTNGLGDVQRARVARLGLAGYFDAVIISSEVGVSKPSTAIFDIAFDQLGAPARSSALMVGDSLTSDIRGGTNYGIATCWYNPHGHAAADTDRIDHEIDTIGGLIDVVIGTMDPPPLRSA